MRCRWSVTQTNTACTLHFSVIYIATCKIMNISQKQNSDSRTLEQGVSIINFSRLAVPSSALSLATEGIQISRCWNLPLKGPTDVQNNFCPDILCDEQFARWKPKNSKQNVQQARHPGLKMCKCAWNRFTHSRIRIRTNCAGKLRLTCVCPCLSALCMCCPWQWACRWAEVFCCWASVASWFPYIRITLPHTTIKLITIS